MRDGRVQGGDRLESHVVSVTGPAVTRTRPPPSPFTCCIAGMKMWGVVGEGGTPVRMTSQQGMDEVR